MPRQKKDPHFRAARLKLERARTHLAELERTVTEFVVSNPITVTTKLEGEAFMFYADLNRDFPRHFPGILGDIIHNLRASLDLLASELVRMNGGNDSHTYFPFAESADKLEEQIKNRNMHLAAPEVVDHVRALKPYKGGSAALRGVHDLDIMDKHRELIPTTGMVMIEFMGAGGDVEHMRADRMIAGFGTEAEAALASGLTPDTTIPSTFELTFEWNSPFQTKELIPTLHSLVEEFTGVVDSFEAICFGTIREKHSAT